MTSTNAKSSILLGLTGSIGSGKSEVARLFEQRGAVLIDADILAREAVQPGSEGLQAVRNCFGPEYLQPDGSLNRKKLGELVFSDPRQRQQLESILHPRIRALFLERLTAAQAGSPALIVYVVPLLFESGFDYQEIDRIAVVYAPREICLQRIMQRDSMGREAAERRYASQAPIEEKVAQADFVIDNSAERTKLVPQVEKIFNALNSRTSK